MSKNKGLSITALYERLSRDDDNQGESNSISNQKMFLENYAKRQGFTSIRHFTDDGYTGRNFRRPGFQAMLKEIQDGNVSVVIVKDLSRFGRNYLEVGFYTDILFPQKDVRFIAVNNNVDSENQTDNDFTPFLNIMNEWYAKDTSNKIKAVFDARMKEGKRCSGGIPFGYNRNPNDKQKLLVDPEASKVVRKIFELAAGRKNRSEIARILEEEKILIPSAYYAKYHPEQNNHRFYEDPYRWRLSVVSQILNRREYLGHTVLKKSEKTNFKMDKRKTVPPEERLVFMNTHEPIISEELWKKAHKFLDSRRLLRNGHPKEETEKHNHILNGYLFCADCGSRMTMDTYRDRYGNPFPTYRCGTYGRNPQKCTHHYINGSALERIVLHMIQRVVKRTISDEKGFALYLKQMYANKKKNQPEAKKKELIEIKNRNEEVNTLTRSLYENYIKNAVSERQYRILMEQYDAEQALLEKRITELSEEIEKAEHETINVQRFLDLIKKYKEPCELSNELLDDLIDKILIYQAEGKGMQRTQKVDIVFNCVGEIELIETPEEAEERRQRELEIQNHQAEMIKRKRDRDLERWKKIREQRLQEREGHHYNKRTCRICGKEFWPTNSTGMYCSAECKRKAINERAKIKNRVERLKDPDRLKTCVICGKKFIYMTGKQKTCSRECSEQLVRIRSRERYERTKDQKLLREKEKRQEERMQKIEENSGNYYPLKTCECCGKTYRPNSSSQRYCSLACGRKGWLIEKRNLPPSSAETVFHPQKKCVICGKTFRASSARQLTCSEECAIKRRNQLRKQRRQSKK